MDDLRTFGESLRQAREHKEISLEEMERLTRIRLKFLEAMEAGDFSFVADNALQLRGFLRNYAYNTGLNPETVLEQYNAAVDASQSGKRGRRRRKDTEEYMPPTLVSTKTMNLNGATPAQTMGFDADSKRSQGIVGRALRSIGILLVAGGLAVGVIGGIYVAINSATADDNEPEDAPAPIVEFNPSATVTIEPTQPGIELQPPTQATPDLRTSDQLFIRALAEERLWISVTVDGVVQYQGVLPPGSGVQYTANESITIRTTNARGLNININNQEYRLGTERIQASQTFTKDGLIQPTNQPTSEAAATVEAPDTEDQKFGSNTEASPTAALLISPTNGNVPTLLPSPIQQTNTPTLPPPTVGPSSTPTATLTNTPEPTTTFTSTSTPTVTNTPTIVVTPTVLLPPRNTRTPAPDK
ncbi:MAG: DUF4115 domain-containing protein [Chloroflexi bacterium]|nr:DUF4115 domain-containing protein [Chloroflexota bacterium]